SRRSGRGWCRGDRGRPGTPGRPRPSHREFPWLPSRDRSPTGYRARPSRTPEPALPHTPVPGPCWRPRSRPPCLGAGGPRPHTFCYPRRTFKRRTLMRPFEGIKILDCTHVLAGPFAAYQLAVLGADVIKVDDPNEPDQSRESGADHALNQAMMGTGFLTQGSNKRAIALDLKTEGGCDALKRLVADWADVLVENYRPGAFKALGLGYEDLVRLNPTLVYASMTAFGQGGPRGTQTAYDHAIQATSGITASTGTETTGPIKAGAPMVDYATGTMGA